MLYAGHPDKAVDYLYAMANHAAPTRVWREEQSLAASDNADFVGDMPHNWASAEFVRLVRHLLVFERGETLELLPALPPEWLRPGAEVRVDRTPTRFGPCHAAPTLRSAGKSDVCPTTWMPPGRVSRPASGCAYPARCRRNGSLTATARSTCSQAGHVGWNCNPTAAVCAGRKEGGSRERCATEIL